MSQVIIIRSNCHGCIAELEYGIKALKEGKNIQIIPTGVDVHICVLPIKVDNK